MMTNEGPKLYSPNSAAKALDISRAQIYLLMKLGRIRYVQVGADRRIPAEEIQRITEEGAKTSTAE